MPIVWLPGLPCTGAVFGPLTDRFGGTVFDLPTGSGWGRIADGLAARLPERCVLAGLSMGGCLALELRRRVPERIAALVMIDTSARADGEEAKARRAALSAMGRGKGIGAVAAALTPALPGPRAQGNPALAGLVRDMARTIGAETFATHQAALTQRPDSRPDLPGVAVPVLAVTGARDAITPRALGREIAAGVPDGT